MRTVKPGMCVVTALAVAALAAGALASQGAPAADAKVQIDQYAFLPQRITVKPGTTVTWTNDDDETHTVTATDRAYTSSGLEHAERYAHRFTARGTYTYFCALHPHMTATVVVR